MRILKLIFVAALLLSVAGIAYAQNGEENVTNVTPGANETPGANVTMNVTPAITVTDQTITGNATFATVVVENVSINTSGWVAIHNSLLGEPGGLVGFAPVQPGTTQNVTVLIDSVTATDTLIAELHLDLGQPGAFEWPPTDTPVMVNGTILEAPFNVTAENFTLKNLTQVCQSVPPGAVTGPVANMTANMTPEETPQQMGAGASF
ncbi:MAG: hypothetical protein QMD46_08815 [Methanomicrobiales archaeon]|nr:hypothetical protein [Methanomicrobiales archaeon]MDI6875468.1 hypothetical protein [Methanomicrobiales archaeon]